MRTRISVRLPGGLQRDLELRAPTGAVLADVATHLADLHPTGQPSQCAVFWSGSRAVPTNATLGGPGLRSGCVVGLGEPGPRTRAEHSVLRLHVVTGPDAGVVAPIPRGLMTIGRGPDCDVRLTDPDVSRIHLELAVTAAGVSVRDLSSSNGSRLLMDDGQPSQPINADGLALPVGAHLALGQSLLCVVATDFPAAVTTMTEDGQLLVNRPPRMNPKLDQPPVEFPATVRHGLSAGVPWLAATLPALGGVAMAYFMHNPQFLAFALLSPLIMLGTSVGDRLSGRRGRRRQQQQSRSRQLTTTAALQRLAAQECQFRRLAHPDPATVRRIATTPDVRIWLRRPDDPDFLELRLGLSDQPARLVVRRGTEREPSPVLASVPVCADIRDGPLGVCGPRTLVLGSARWLVGQLAALHSPADLRLVALLGDHDLVWSALRWLPHLGLDGETPLVHGRVALAHDQQTRQSLILRLQAEIERRSDHPGARQRGSEDAHRWPGSWIVLLIDGTGADISGLEEVLRDGPAVGITAICLETERRRLPPPCHSVGVVSGTTGTRIDIGHCDDPSSDQSCALTDQVSVHWLDQICRALAPLADPGLQVEGSMPARVRLLDLLNLSDRRNPSRASSFSAGFSAEQLIERWQRGEARVTTALGRTQNGVFELDLARDGPHALIAGTTGAGKSELLQSLVAGLAFNASPMDLQFVLVDYKGGAAFADCARLPHAAGLVTDLDAHLTERALRSLDAELRLRERAFAEAGVADLDAYRDHQRHLTEPLGRLVLVVDEFAALAEELPDFIIGLVGIAQRGRSLGVHLVLATQRPGGVVSPEIRANAALRIALRVTDPAESSDVLGREDAAHIDKQTPGRAVVRIGAHITQVQIGRVGGVHDDNRPDVEVVAVDAWGTAEPGQVTGADSGPTDLELLVDTVRTASARLGLQTARRPWLDPLPDHINAQALRSATTGPPTQIALGQVDLPAAQSQRPFVVDLADGSSLLLAGGGRSGRTSALRTLATIAAQQLTVAQLHLYVIDCAGGGLRALGGLPHCGAVVTRDSPATIDRLLSRLATAITARQSTLVRLGVGTVSEAATIGHPLPAQLLLLDGWDGFVEAVEEIDAGRPVDTLLRLIRDAAAVGLTVVIAGDRSTLSARLSSAMQRRLVLRLSDPNDYAMTGLSKRAIPERMPPGRAVDCSDGSEIQLAVLGTDASAAGQLATVAQIAAEATRAEATRTEATRTAEPKVEATCDTAPLRIKALPEQVTIDQLESFRQREQGNLAQVLLGVGGDEAGPISLRLSGTAARMLVAGPPRSGRSSTLITIAVQLRRQAIPVALASGRRSGLTAYAQQHHIALISPEDIELPVLPHGAVFLIDDVEAFTDTAIGDQLAVMLRQDATGLSVVAAGRNDDLAVTFRGLAAELKKARTGILLQPGPGDGDLLGIRLPFGRSRYPVGRGLLVADTLLDEGWPSPLPIQIAQP